MLLNRQNQETTTKSICDSDEKLFSPIIKLESTQQSVCYQFTVYYEFLSWSNRLKKKTLVVTPLNDKEKEFPTVRFFSITVKDIKGILSLLDWILSMPLGNVIELLTIKRNQRTNERYVNKIHKISLTDYRFARVKYTWLSSVCVCFWLLPVFQFEKKLVKKKVVERF